MFKKFLTIGLSCFIIFILGLEPSLIYLTLAWLVPVTIFLWYELIMAIDGDSFLEKLTGTPSQSPKKRN